MPRVVIVGEDSTTLARLIDEECMTGLETVLGDNPELLAEAEIVLGSPAEIAEILDSATGLQWVQSTWAGVTPLINHARRDYLLTGVKGIFGQSMSEYVLGWLLALERNVIQRVIERRWDERIEEGLGGKRLGMMGTGSISMDLARACNALGLSVTGLNSTGRDVAGFEACYATADCLAFASGLDYLVALLPDTPATDELVNAELLAQLSTGAILINAGRANSVVDADLLAALASGQLRAAVLDVTREEPLPEGHPFWSVENLYLSSHTAAPSSPEAVARVFADNYRRYVQGQPLLYQVDFERGY